MAEIGTIHDLSLLRAVDCLPEDRVDDFEPAPLSTLFGQRTIVSTDKLLSFLEKISITHA